MAKTRGSKQAKQVKGKPKPAKKGSRAGRAKQQKGASKRKGAKPKKKGGITASNKRRAGIARKQYALEDIELAAEAVRTKKLGLNSAARKFAVPRSTLQDRVGRYVAAEASTLKPGKKSILSAPEEELLVQWIFDKQALGQAVPPTVVAQKVKEICEAAGRTTPFTNGVPGRKWWSGFLGRHPQVSLRVAEGLDRSRSAAQASASTNDFYRQLGDWYAAHPNCRPPRNMDETGWQPGNTAGTRVLAQKGSKLVQRAVSENRENTTFVGCIAADGTYIEPVYIFKGKRSLTANWLREGGAHPNAKMAVQENGYMTAELFPQWLQHYIDTVPSGVSPEDPDLVVLDGHSSRISDEAIELARSRGVHILLLPGHLSHWLQPLDVAVFWAFKKAARRELQRLLALNPERKLTKADVVRILEVAKRAAFTEENIKAGFRATGIWPFNPHAMDAKLEEIQSAQRKAVWNAEEAIAGLPTCNDADLAAVVADALAAVNKLTGVDCTLELEAEEGNGALPPVAVGGEGAAEGLSGVEGVHQGGLAREGTARSPDALPRVQVTVVEDEGDAFATAPGADGVGDEEELDADAFAVEVLAALRNSTTTTPDTTVETRTAPNPSSRVAPANPAPSDPLAAARSVLTLPKAPTAKKKSRAVVTARLITSDEWQENVRKQKVEEKRKREAEEAKRAAALEAKRIAADAKAEKAAAAKARKAEAAAKKKREAEAKERARAARASAGGAVKKRKLAGRGGKDVDDDMGEGAGPLRELLYGPTVLVAAAGADSPDVLRASMLTPQHMQARAAAIERLKRKRMRVARGP